MMHFGWRIPPSCYRKVGAECPNSDWFWILLVAAGFMAVATSGKKKGVK